MANLVQIAEELEYMPKDQLAQMTQDPNSTYPQFLVLSEIQRRTQLERAYQAQAEGMGPQTTVAEETVAEFMGPQGLQGMAEQPMPQDMQPPMQQPMAESPMQMAANGGRTGFMQGGISTRGSLLNTMGIEHTGMTEQEMGNLIGGINREEEQAPRSFGLMDREIVPEISEPETDMMADGGRTGFFAMGSTALSTMTPEDQYLSQQGMIDDISARYTDEDGTVNWNQAVKDGVITAATLATLAPSLTTAAAVGTGRGLLGAAKLFTPTGFKSGLQYLKGASNKVFDKLGQRALSNKYNLGPKSRFGTTQAIPAGIEVAKKAAPRIIGGGILAGTAIDSAIPERAEETITEDKIETPAEMQARIRKEEQDKYQKQLNQLKGLTEGKTKKSGLFSNISQDQGLTIAQLGGVLMGAKNMSELGTGIAGVAGQAQDRRSSAGLAGAQQAYYESQAKEADAKVANMKPKELISLMEVSKDMMKAINEGAGDSSQIADIQAQYKAAYLRYMELTGGEMPVADDPYAASGVKIT